MSLKIKILLAVLGVAVLASAGVLFFGKQKLPATGQVGDCITSKDIFEVRGNSLSGVLEAGDKVVADMGYYSCNEPRLGDIVLFHWAGDASPIIKVIRAVPGD